MQYLYTFVAFFASIGGIIFFLHRLFSEPYSLNIEVPNLPDNSNIYIYIKNTTGYSLTCKTFFEYCPTEIIGLIGCSKNIQKNTSSWMNGDLIISPDIIYKIPLGSLNGISEQYGLNDSLFENHGLAINFNISFDTSGLPLSTT